MADEAEFPRSHNYETLPLDEQAKVSIDQALIPSNTRWTELEASAGRAPAEITSEFIAENFTTLIAQLGALEARIERAHADAKAPYLEAGRVIDGVKTKLLDKVSGKKKELQTKLTAYQTAKQAKIEAERAALRAADEAKGDPEPAFVDTRAQDRKVVTIRSSEGASAHLAADIEVEIVDVKKIPKRYLMRPKVLAAICAELKPDLKKGDVVAGAKSKTVQSSRVRRG